MPDAENRDPRQLLWHRHRLVQMRTRVMNQLHVVALNEGLRRKKAPAAAGGAIQRRPTPGYANDCRRSQSQVGIFRVDGRVFARKVGMITC